MDWCEIRSFAGALRCVVLEDVAGLATAGCVFFWPECTSITSSMGGEPFMLSFDCLKRPVFTLLYDGGLVERVCDFYEFCMRQVEGVAGVEG